MRCFVAGEDRSRCERTQNRRAYAAPSVLAASPTSLDGIGAGEGGIRRQIRF
jgi:hypothetical protein